MYPKIIFFIYLAVLVIMSIITFFVFIRDKRLAKKGAMRIKERTLLGFTAFGGAIGALLGRFAAKHKTGKLYFTITIFFSLAVQVGVLVFLLVVMLK